MGSGQWAAVGFAWEATAGLESEGGGKSMFGHPVIRIGANNSNLIA